MSTVHLFITIVVKFITGNQRGIEKCKPMFLEVTVTT